MENDESTPAWVRPVDGATCAALSRELWGMLSAAGVSLTVVEFCNYITSATLAFQRKYADAEWGVTHGWMEETEAFLVRYLREFPIPELEEVWDSTTLPLPDEDERDRARVGYEPPADEEPREPGWWDNEDEGPMRIKSTPRPADDDEAISYAVRLDVLAESGGREVAVALARADIPHINYGSGIIEVLWGLSSADLRVQVFGDGEAAVADVHIVRLMDDGHTDYYDEVAEGIPLAEVVEVVRGVLAKVHAE